MVDRKGLLRGVVTTPAAEEDLERITREGGMAMTENTCDDRELLARLETLAEEVAELRHRIDRTPQLGPETERIARLLEEMGGRVSDLWDRGVEEVTSGRRAPLTAATLAFGAGLLLGALTRRK